MGSFIFTWEHPADEVYVTGTFDDWSKSERLDKTDHVFTKEVMLPNISEKIYYKFVVDGNWVTDHTAPQEKDELGNLNNVLTADRITKLPSETINIMSGITPDSSTVHLTSKVPLEKNKTKGSTILPGTFPETPAAVDKSETDVVSNQSSSVEAPITNPQSISTEEAQKSTNSGGNAKSEVANKEKEQTFSISPLPAFPGAVNPISIAPGEKLPDYRNLTNNTLTSLVDLGGKQHEYSETSQSKSSSFPSESTSRTGNDATNMYALELPEISKNFIPESSLPIGLGDQKNFDLSSIFQSLGPQSTTVDLASGVSIDHSKLPLHKSADDSAEKSTENPFIQSVSSQSTAADLAAKVPVGESSDLPVNSKFATESPFIQSVSPQSTTADLAGKVPADESSNLPVNSKFATESPFIQSVSPQSTTADLAGKVPADESSNLPVNSKFATESPFIQSVSPQSTAADLAAKVPVGESSDLPVNSKFATESPFIQSVSPQSTTADLAGKVPADESSNLPVNSKFATESPFIQSVSPQSTTSDLAGIVPVAESTKLLSREKSAVDFMVNPNTSDDSKVESGATSGDLAPADRHKTTGQKSADFASHSSPKSVALATSSLDPAKKLSEPLSEIPPFPSQTSHYPLNSSLTKINLDSSNQKSEGLKETENSAGEIDLNSNSIGSAQPSQSDFMMPHTVTTVSASGEEQNSTNLDSSKQDMVACRPSISSQAPIGNCCSPSANSEKNDKKKKRLSIFGKLKAKLTSKDKD